LESFFFKIIVKNKLNTFFLKCEKKLNLQNIQKKYTVVVFFVTPLLRFFLRFNLSPRFALSLSLSIIFVLYIKAPDPEFACDFKTLLQTYDHTLRRMDLFNFFFCFLNTSFFVNTKRVGFLVFIQTTRKSD
jgi:hypothetical protein